MVSQRCLAPATEMLKVHFLNVGHGDCTIIEHPSGRLTIIDINNGTDVDSQSALEVASYLSASVMREVREAQSIQANQISVLTKAGYDVELTNPIEYLARLRPDKSVFRYIQTHPDLDHMRGLVALRGNGFSIANFWDTQHVKEPDFGGPKAEQDRLEWDEYQTTRSGQRGQTVLNLHRAAAGHFYNREADGNAGGDSIGLDWKLMVSAPVAA